MLPKHAASVQPQSSIRKKMIFGVRVDAALADDASAHNKPDAAKIHRRNKRFMGKRSWSRDEDALASAHMKFGICNEIFQNWALADAMRYAKAAGYDCIELAPFTLLPGTAEKYVTAIPATERTLIRETCLLYTSDAADE